MKKWTLTLLMALAAAVACGQSSARDEIVAYLQAEGYVPTVDDDGDILFKIEGKAYYISSEYDEDYELYYIKLFMNLYSDDVTMERALVSCNAINQGYKLIRCYAVQDTGGTEGRIYYSVSAASFVKSAKEFLQSYPWMLSCVQTGREKLIDELND
ncbi:MAG: YbjN domain-containing protein [Rikenellaceae bacterium]|nr:YbjN domain-containing protein [Rikenellaceae bacterium]